MLIPWRVCHNVSQGLGHILRSRGAFLGDLEVMDSASKQGFMMFEGA